MSPVGLNQFTKECNWQSKEWKWLSATLPNFTHSAKLIGVVRV